MGDEIRYLEHEIDQARARLGENLQELEHRVARVTDWRGYVQERPFGMVSLAFAGGLFLAATLRGASHRSYRRAESSWRGPVSHSLDAIGGALAGIVVARLTAYISELVPDFVEHYERAQHSRQSP